MSNTTYLNWHHLPQLSGQSGRKTADSENLTTGWNFESNTLVAHDFVKDAKETYVFFKINFWPPNLSLELFWRTMPVFASRMQRME